MRSSSSQNRSDSGGSAPAAGGAAKDFPEGFPQVFGKYVLVRPMAKGGMGELFIAAAGETGGFEKLCVVKKVLRSLEDAAVHRRFLDEAKVVVRLNHANLVQVFDAGKVDNEYYLAMELVEGKDLRAVWNRCAQLHRRIPVDIAIFVIREVLRGLEYVHDAMALELVHRDISPPNLLVGYRGDVKLTDFGLAKSSIKREMTSPGVVFGRYSYLSPEQARGLPADRRTDLYACGIVLWELLTGRQLFPSSNRSHQEALEAVRHPKVRPPSTLVPGIPDGLDAVVLKSLERDRDRRYAGAGEFRAALSDIIARNFPSCDADRASEFMREIFTREAKTEQRDYTKFSQQNFSGLRAAADDSELISISDVLDAAKSPTMSLGESDIVEMDQPGTAGLAKMSARSLRESAREWVGRVVSARYRIDTLIGIGGMGAVFRATHLALGKPFALKVLHKVYTRDAEIVTRFMREARAATHTGHPNIIDVIDIGTSEGGEVYFVMELLDGQNLGAVVRTEGPLAVRRTVHIARQICRGLAAAHEAQIIHRDLKSENVILTSRGKDPDFVKILDFGICKHMNADAATTSPGLVMGSPDYMAPEQGAGLEATAASDIYAVGCILFEMLTGRMPFMGRNAVDVLMQKGAREAPRVDEFRAEVPSALATVIARCLRRQATDRPPSMRALEYELTRAVDGRASAVAAVLGIGGTDTEGALSGGRDDSSADSSASMHRAAIASLESSAFADDGRTELRRSLEQTTERSAPLELGDRGRSRPFAAALRALFFVVLGGLLAGTALLAFSPETMTRLGVAIGWVKPHPQAPETRPERTAPAQSARPDPEIADADAAGTPIPPVPLPIVPDAVRDLEAREPVAAPPVPSPGADTSSAQWVIMADAALERGEYTEPHDRALATAIARLELLDPGNEAIGRLRRAAAEKLLPLGDGLAKEKQYAEAAAAYRDLRRVWPDHPEAKTLLVGALLEVSKRHRADRQFEEGLATADELLNLAPEDFEILVLKADMLWYLERWTDCREAYAAAKKQKPRNSFVNKRYWKCRAKSKREDG